MKVLVAEDDFIVRQGIIQSLDWEAYGLTICAAVGNGEQGMKSAEECNPDIIITDIRMPIMDGLKFAEEMKALRPSVRIIILSGYDDFEYAKKAIHIGIYEYLLKPIDAEELLKCVCKLRDEIEREREIKKLQEDREELLKENRPQIYERLMKQVILPSFKKDKKELLEKLYQVGALFHGPKYKAVLLEFQKIPLSDEGEGEEEKSGFWERVGRIISEEFSDGYETEMFRASNFRYVIILNYAAASEISEESCCLRAAEKLSGEMGVRCAISRGSEKDNMEEIYLSYQDAVKSLREEKEKYSVVIIGAMEFIERHYAEEISAKRIADELFITPNYFSRIFKTAVGMNFTDYLNEFRVRKAKILLSDMKYKVYQVAEMAGYQNYKYFNKVFKKYTGYSPKEYRNQFGKEQQTI